MNTPLRDFEISVNECDKRGAGRQVGQCISMGAPKPGGQRAGETRPGPISYPSHISIGPNQRGLRGGHRAERWKQALCALHTKMGGLVSSPTPNY